MGQVKGPHWPRCCHCDNEKKCPSSRWMESLIDGSVIGRCLWKIRKVAFSEETQLRAESQLPHSQVHLCSAQPEPL